MAASLWHQRRAIRHGLKHAGRRLVIGTSKSIDLARPERSRQVPYLLTESEQLLRRVVLSSDQVQRRDVVLPSQPSLRAMGSDRRQKPPSVAEC